MNTNEKSRGTLFETFNPNITVNVFYPFYFNPLLPKCIHHSIVHSPLISVLESVLHYMNAPCDQHEEFTSAARTPVTNHVFHCTLPFSLIMSNSAQNTPPHHHHLDTLCWESDYYSCCTFLWRTTKHRGTEGNNIRLRLICNYNLEWSKNAFDYK